MTKDEIEKLAHEFMKDNSPKVWNESAYLEVEKAFKAGYLKGVESLSKENSLLRSQLQVVQEILFRYQSNGSLFGKENLEKEQWWIENRNIMAMAFMCACMTRDVNKAIEQISELESQHNKEYK